MNTHAIATLVIVWLGCPMEAVRAATHRFDHVELQSFDGGNTSAIGINQSGIIAGMSGRFVNRDAFVCDSSGVLTNIDQVGFQNCVAIAINNAGQVAGRGDHDTVDCCVESVFRYTPAVGMENLGQFTGVLVGMNNNGDLIGFQKLDKPDTVFHAFVYSDALGWQDIGTLGPVKINDAGQIAGATGFGVPMAQSHAFVWQDGVVTDLGTLGGVESGATDMNNAGTVVGWSYDADWHTRAFRYTAKEGMQALPLPAEATNSSAIAINDVGMILIGYALADLTQHIALLLPDGELVDVPLLEGFPTGNALAMNNLGHVVGANVLVIGSAEIVSAFYWSQETGTIQLDNAIISQLPWTIFNPVAINDSDEILVRTFLENGEVAALVRPALDGDVNGDRIVNVDDLLGLINSWGACAAKGGCPADFNANGVVDVDDLLELINHWD